MGGTLFKTTSRIALMTAAGALGGSMLLSQAHAADLGGDCCADLEERVAELEATTIRSGNRKLRVKLSGQVNTALMFWDDGLESDVYVMDNDEASTRIRIDATGTIRPGLTAGLVLEFDVEVAGGASISEADDDGGVTPGSGGFRIQARRANWYVKGGMGKISIGQGSMASDGAFEVSFANTWVAGVGYGLAITNINAFTAPNIGVTWGNLGTDYDGFRVNRVRYDSPSLHGFTLSAAWGEDDTYDVAVRYAKEFNGLKVAAAFSYRIDEDSVFFNTTDRATSYGGSIAMLHTPSGIHLQGGWNDYSVETVAMGATAAVESRASQHYWIAAGIQFRASDLGMSDVAVQYIKNDHEQFGVFFPIGPDEAEYTAYGIGFTQDIDAIGGTLYLSYNRHEAEAQSPVLLPGLVVEDEFDQVLFGMRLRY